MTASAHGYVLHFKLSDPVKVAAVRGLPVYVLGFDPLYF